jgi:hypothetical protein
MMKLCLRCLLVVILAMLTSAADAGVSDVPLPSIGSFQTVENNCVGVELLAGDLNGDCEIDFADIAIIAAGWLMEGAA